MLSILLLLLPFSNAQVCDKSNNDPVTDLNYLDCNNAGKCEGSRRTRCECCNKGDSNNWCFGRDEVQVPYIFSGTTCTTATFKYGVTFGWRFESSGSPDLICEDSLTDPPGTGGRGTATQPDLNPTINAAFSVLGYPGIFFAAACQTCRPNNPCSFTNDGAVTQDMTAGFATELNTYYDRTCVTFQIDTPTDCAANTDLGNEAYNAFVTARGETGPTMQLTTTFNALAAGTHPNCTTPTIQASGACLGWTSTSATIYLQNDLDSQRENFIITTKAPTPDPTPTPTDPTEQPTAVPTIPEKCFKYVNRVLDHKFLGSATNCRAGLDDAWPGGKTCDSPYVVCLPDENTPANPDPSEVPNFGQTLPATAYSVQECAEECAFDQRCLGFELRPTAGSDTGLCMLIDDIPVEMTNPGSWPSGVTTGELKSGLAEVAEMGQKGICCTDPNAQTGVSLADCREAALLNNDVNYFSYTIVGGGSCSLCPSCTMVANPLFTSYEITGRLQLGSPANYDAMLASSAEALCFAKEDYCNPFFEAGDLNEEMLECYCPNNRKGTYTKKVKRLDLANTRYCGTDTSGEINTRIQKAQANRMFHLCENWCLFETHNPMTESWYWNPWHKCWREQYAGIGTHRSYCNRVIRDPMTIEQQFINKRSDSFCEKDPNTGEIIKVITEEPTGQPSTFDSDWYLAGAEESCDDVCEAHSKTCDELTTNSLVTGSDTDMDNALQSVNGNTCSGFTTGQEGWALPALYQDGTCVLRHPNTEYTGCNWAVGVGYQRLCACY